MKQDDGSVSALVSFGTAQMNPERGLLNADILDTNSPATCIQAGGCQELASAESPKEGQRKGRPKKGSLIRRKTHMG